jgi:hypothetical protein
MLLFVCFWIALFKTSSTLTLNIFFSFFLNVFLSSSLGVALSIIEILELGFNDFYQEIGRSFRQNIFFKGQHSLQLYLWTKAPWCLCSFQIPLLVCPLHNGLGRTWLSSVLESMLMWQAFTPLAQIVASSKIMSTLQVFHPSISPSPYLDSLVDFQLDRKIKLSLDSFRSAFVHMFDLPLEDLLAWF